MKRAMSIIELSDREQKEIFEIVASILHMGNIGFTENEGVAQILKPESVSAVTKVKRVEFHPCAKIFLKIVSF